MAFLIFILYLVFFSWVIYYQCKKGKIKVKYRPLLLSFFIRVLIGCAVTWWFISQPSDSWRYFTIAESQLELLKNDPLSFFRSFFLPLTIEGSFTKFFLQGHVFDHFRNAIMSKILALLMFVCGKNFYVILVVFNWFIFTATLRLYGTLKNYLEAGLDKTIVFLLLFLFPPLLIWTSMYHKDGFVWAFTCFAISGFFKWLNGKKIGSLLWCLFFVLLILLLRSFVGVTLLMTFGIWYVYTRLPFRRFTIFFWVSLVSFFIFFFLSNLLPDGFNFPQILADKQYAIRTFHVGNTSLPVFPLTESIGSYIANTPYAFYNLFLASWFPGVPVYKSLLPFFENLLVVVALVLFFLFRKQNGFIPKDYAAFIYAFSFFVIINYWIIGQSVPVLGAIVRYRIIFEGFLLLICASMTDFRKMRDSLKFTYTKYIRRS